jgi:hypothetical protein
VNGPAEASVSVTVASLERAWSAIRARHPEVPEVVMVVAAGSDGARRGLKLGHFAGSRWRVADTDRAEVLVGGEGLRRGARDVLGTLLHEAAHGLAHTRRIADTSRGGRYHNRRYRALAEELGLHVTQTPPIGWTRTTVPDSTAHDYQHAIADLTAALRLWRRDEPRSATGGASRNLLACTCGCARRIRVARRTLHQAPILCGGCGQPFQPELDS